MKVLYFKELRTACDEEISSVKAFLENVFDGIMTKSFHTLFSLGIIFERIVARQVQGKVHFSVYPVTSREFLSSILFHSGLFMSGKLENNREFRHTTCILLNFKYSHEVMIQGLKLHELVKFVRYQFIPGA